ncbi:MAG: SUMF1/EgtB/PvdO family nonheme iron enzyme [Candidatus Binatia bacterium]
MSVPDFDQRLARLRAELADHASIARELGIDFERPIRSLGDGYPENSVTLIGKIVERLLKQVWRSRSIAGDPDSKSLNDLIKFCRPYINNVNTLNALTDIQRLRNRSAHDGYEIADEDALLAIRRLLDVLDWVLTSNLVELSSQGPRLDPLVAKKMGFLAGIYSTLSYKLVKKFELSESTVYQLFCRQVGIRAEYIEIILTRSMNELSRVLASSGEGLLKTAFPKLSRFLVLEEGLPEEGAEQSFDDYRVVEYERFVDTIVDITTHVGDAVSLYPKIRSDERMITVGGALLETDPRTGELSVVQSADALNLLRDRIQNSANILVVGRPGSGKTTMLKTIANEGRYDAVRRFRFYLDMSQKSVTEDFSAFVTRTLAPCMAVEENRVYDLFLYLIRAGAVICILDAVDEAVPEINLSAFIRLFEEISDVLSAESAVIISSRYSFLADSPQVRTLLNSSDLVSEKLVQELHAHGIDPIQLPHFCVIRLDDVRLEDGTNGRWTTPLEVFLDGGLSTVLSSATTHRRLAQSISAFAEMHLAEQGSPEVAERLFTYLGSSYLAGKSNFSYVDLYNALGEDVFQTGRIDSDSFSLNVLFRKIDETTVAPLHSVFQEYFSAKFVSECREVEGLAKLLGSARITEQFRSFLVSISNSIQHDDCILPEGDYLVGPSSQLLVRTIATPVEFDRYAVTIGRYKEFLLATETEGCRRWDHPSAPAHTTHEPWWDRLRLPRDDFFSGGYDKHPVTCVNWWDAYAFANFEGKRLPTATEWECAARGSVGRLFPWGDELDITRLNCADTWSGRPLVTYEAWRREIDDGALMTGGPTAVDAHQDNVSEFGIREMSGNVWEWSGTILSRTRSAVICGGSYDNPGRAVQASSKGLYTRNGCSNAVGFRCARSMA